jgi:hypothetical protein
MGGRPQRPTIGIGFFHPPSCFLAEDRANRFDLGEALLEIGLVVSSVTLLTRSRIYWYLGIVASIGGIASVLWGLLIK